MKKKISWIAQYQPARPEGMTDPSRGGFLSKRLAVNYIFTQMCNQCKREREEVSRGRKKHWWSSKFPSCFWEWEVFKIKE